MKNNAKLSMLISGLVACSVLVGCGNAQKSTQTAAPISAKPVPKMTLLWSDYVGWEFYPLMDKLGILKKWADKKHCEINLLKMSYGPSIDALNSSKDAQALSVANFDALISHAGTGLDLTVLYVGDYSNDNDKVIAKLGRNLKNGKKITIALVKNTVSEYALRRYCEMNGIDESKLDIMSVDEKDIVTAFQTTPTLDAVCTFNPYAMMILKEKNTERKFGSSEIPGEIQDLLVMKTQAVKDHPEFAEALTGAWYETLSIIKEGGQRAEEAIAIMAQEANCTPDEFKAQLKTTKMFYTPQEALEFTNSKDLMQGSMQRMSQFCVKRQFVTGKGPGISFPDGTVQNDATNVKLRYESRFMQEAAEGSL